MEGYRLIMGGVPFRKADAESVRGGSALSFSQTHTLSPRVSEFLFVQTKKGLFTVHGQINNSRVI